VRIKPEERKVQTMGKEKANKKDKSEAREQSHAKRKPEGRNTPEHHNLSGRKYIDVIPLPEDVERWARSSR
jgi:hypothetical protein